MPRNAPTVGRNGPRREPRKNLGEGDKENREAETDDGARENFIRAIERALGPSW
jgi:hypothetical protein